MKSTTMKSTTTTMKSTCLAPDCKRPRLCRGLCSTHYAYTTRLIANKKAPSFRVLEERGKVLPSKRARKSGFVTWLNGK